MNLNNYVGINNNDKLKIINECHLALLKSYPGLILHWSQIYGKRWSHCFGEVEQLGTQTKRIQISEEYGVCIENAEILPSGAIDEIVQFIKKHFHEQPN